MDSTPPCTIRPATPADADAMARVEERARALFDQAGVPLGRLSLPDDLTEDTSWDLAVVALAGDEVIGMARCTALTSRLLCLDQVSVVPARARLGVGTRLLQAVATAARDAGFNAITGTTFTDVAFNGPMYRRLGAVEDADPHPAMLRRRAVERSLGLDAHGERTILRIDL